MAEKKRIAVLVSGGGTNLQALIDAEKKGIIKEFTEVLGSKAAPTEFESLNNLENQIMGLFLAMEPSVREEQLSKLTARATAEVRRRRNNLF